MTNMIDNNYTYQKEANVLCLLEDIGVLRTERSTF